MNVIVLVGTDTDAEALGAAAQALATDDTRTAVFLGDVTTPEGRAALEEFVTELFPTAQSNRRHLRSLERPE